MTSTFSKEFAARVADARARQGPQDPFHFFRPMRSSRNRLERKPAEAYCLFRICLNPMIIFFNLSVCAGARIDSNIYLGYSTVVTVAARQKSRRAQHFNNACRRKLLNGIVYLPFCLRGRAIRIHTRDVAVVGTVGRLAWARGLDQPWPGPRPGWPDQTGLCEAAALHGALASLQWARRLMTRS